MENFVREPKGIQEFTAGCRLMGREVVDRQKLVKECTGVYKNVKDL